MESLGTGIKVSRGTRIFTCLPSRRKLMVT